MEMVPLVFLKVPIIINFHCYCEGNDVVILQGRKSGSVRFVFVMIEQAIIIG